MNMSNETSLVRYDTEAKTVDEVTILTPSQDEAAIVIGGLYRKARSSIVDSVLFLIEAGRRLTEKKKSLPHGAWLSWLTANEPELGFGVNAAQRLMKAANTALTQHLSEHQALAINRQIWGNQSALFSSESNEWFTPAEYVEAVREVLGEIDLDPASCPAANEVVRAKRFYTIEDDGLEQPWHGRFFVNPPYGGQAEAFCQRAIDEYASGNVEAGIILVNSVHDQDWQAPLFDFPVCFVNTRIQFISSDGTENKSPTNRNIFVYLGSDPEKFARVFDPRLGFVMTRLARR
jgi:hypothetical protein